MITAGIYIHGEATYKVDRKGRTWRYTERGDNMFLERCDFPLGAMRVYS